MTIIQPVVASFIQEVHVLDEEAEERNDDLEERERYMYYIIHTSHILQNMKLYFVDKSGVKVQSPNNRILPAETRAGVRRNTSG